MSSAEERRRVHVAVESCMYKGANAEQRAANTDYSFNKSSQPWGYKIWLYILLPDSSDP